MRRQNSYRSRQLPSTSSSRHDLSPSQAERKSPSGSDRKRSALSKSKSPSLVTTAARTNVLTLENVMEIKFPSVNEMERYIQENNAQIISRNDCLNMQPTETPHHSAQPVETPHHSAQSVETPQHSAYCAEPPAMLSSPLGKNDAHLCCGDNIFEKFNGKYPSGDEVSVKLNQYLEESKKELEDLFAEPEEEVMDCEKLEFVLGIVMQRIKSLQCLLYLENFGKTYNFDRSIHRDLFDSMIGIFCNCQNLHKDYYGQTVDFVKSKLDDIFTGEKVTRKYIYDVLVPECFTFAVMKILCVSNAVASNIRHIGFSVQQVNQLCAKFKRD
ncbi:Uncharacterized protein APZ42_021957 [Daphnia magna]|uniref:Uncharacterized protein n=1 Tax=Daphnia magna TaxID=35525 RepID=A0A164W7J2_9CRUS|nr:Uncharacterized protein APZ42_021957 [Daphnia magna]